MTPIDVSRNSLENWTASESDPAEVDSKASVSGATGSDTREENAEHLSTTPREEEDFKPEVIEDGEEETSEGTGPANEDEEIHSTTTEETPPALQTGPRDPGSNEEQEEQAETVEDKDDVTTKWIATIVRKTPSTKKMRRTESQATRRRKTTTEGAAAHRRSPNMSDK
jgi:hypothetical protein